MADKTIDRSGVAFPPILVSVVTLALAVALEFILPIFFLPSLFAAGWQIGAGAILLACGAAIGIPPLFAFWRAGTSFMPGQTTSRIVRSGSYHLTRNPMYLGLLLGQTGIALILSLEWGIVLLPLAWLGYDRLVIAKEEAYLKRKFGADYEALLASTRRWL